VSAPSWALFIGSGQKVYFPTLDLASTTKKSLNVAAFAGALKLKIALGKRYSFA